MSRSPRGRSGSRSSLCRVRPHARSAPRSASSVRIRVRSRLASSTAGPRSSGQARGCSDGSASSITSHPPGRSAAIMTRSAAARSSRCTSTSRAWTRSTVSAGGGSPADVPPVHRLPSARSTTRRSRWPAPGHWLPRAPPGRSVPRRRLRRPHSTVARVLTLTDITPAGILRHHSFDRDLMRYSTTVIPVP